MSERPGAHLSSRLGHQRPSYTPAVTRRDLGFVAVCALLFAGSLAVVLVWFDEAFPEASIEFRVGREESREIAEELLSELGIGIADARHGSEFDWDNLARIFLERSLKPDELRRVLDEDVELWYWRHRWFRPLEVEEVHIDVAPSGEPVGLEHVIAEDAARGPLGEDGETRARLFLEAHSIGPSDLRLIGMATRRLPNRIDTTFTFESLSIKPAGAPWRARVTFHGDRIGGFRQYLDVPESWTRSYASLRSKNVAAGAVDTFLLLFVAVAALAIFIARLRRGDVAVRFVVVTGAVGAVLAVLVVLNDLPAAVVSYDTDTSWRAFLAGHIVFSILEAIVLGVFLMVIVGSGEALYRQRLPEQLAMPRLFQPAALRSRRVLCGLVLGYALVPAFIAYQTLFYVVASKFGAWSPADVPYAEILNSAFPWAAVLFMGFFPAVSEEFLSRAFSIPLFERLFRSTFAALVVAGFLWGFGHAAYPNQPFWIRGVEVGIVGVVAGVLMLRFGLLPLLVWHYTVDAVYTALLLFRSENTYYIVSAGVASLVMLVPLLVSLALLARHRRFVDDDDLTNRACGTAAAEELPAAEEAPIEGATPLRRSKLAIAAVLAVVAAIGWIVRPPIPDDVIEYAIPEERAVAIAEEHLRDRAAPAESERIVTFASPGFRSWNEQRGPDEGGSPGAYARIGAERILETGGVDRLVEIQRDAVEAATWVVRFFTPERKEETFVEIDPRRGEAVGLYRALDESTAGARLGREDAEQLAIGEMRRRGFDAAGFELREALPIEQANRADWLFHFDERDSLASGVVRRISVRLGGDEVTRFAKTVRIAETVVRMERRQTLWQTVLVVAQLAGALVLLTIVAHGFVSSIRDDGFRWRSALRLTAALSPLALVAVALRIPDIAAGYDTAISWNTYLVTASLGLAMPFVVQLGVAAVSAAVIDTLRPGAFRLARRDARARFGRDAAASAVAFAAAIALAGLGVALLPRLAPTLVPVHALTVPSWIAIPAPAILWIWRSVLAALVFTAAAGGIAASVRASGRPRTVLFIAGTSLALLALDPGANGVEIASTVALGIGAAAALLLASRTLLGNNPLSWFAAPAIAVLAMPLPRMLGASRGDLVINGVVLCAVAVAWLAWLAWPGREGRASLSPARFR